MDLLFSEITILQWSLLALCAMLSGMSKAGVPGVSLISIPILAFIFGGKQSTGVLLPILMMADLFAIFYYRRHANWSLLLKILPFAFVGIGLALWVGEVIDDELFKEIIAIVIFICIGIMIWRDRKKDDEYIPDNMWFAGLMGVFGGFATMIGNAAGPIFMVYLLALKLPKNSFVGTRAWFFVIINFSKFPLHILIWKTINWNTLSIDLVTLPAIAIGAYLGFKIVKAFSEKAYRAFVFIVTAISAFILLI